MLNRKESHPNKVKIKEYSVYFATYVQEVMDFQVVTSRKSIVNSIY